MGEAFTGGLKKMFAPISTEPSDIVGPLSYKGDVERIFGALEAAGSPLQPAANLVTKAGERVSDYLRGKGYGSVGDVAAGLTTGIGDYATGAGLAKGLSLIKAPLAKALPTIKERVGFLNTEKAGQLAANEKVASDAQLAVAQRQQGLATEANQRLTDLDKLASEAQAAAAKGQAERLQEIPAARTLIRKGGAEDITAVEQQLAEQQRAVGI